MTFSSGQLSTEATVQPTTEGNKHIVVYTHANITLLATAMYSGTS